MSCKLERLRSVELGVLESDRIAVHGLTGDITLELGWGRFSYTGAESV